MCALATFSCLGDLSQGCLNSDKLRRTEHAVETYRAHIDTRKAEKYGFASMAAVPYAHAVAQLLAKKHPKGTDIGLAPNPRDIVSKIIPAFGVLPTLVYTDLGKLEPVHQQDGPQEDDGLVPNHHHRVPEHRPAFRAFHSRQLVLRVYCDSLFLPDFSLIPCSKIASFAPFLQHWSQSSPASFNIISGVLPPAVSAFFGFFLPIMMRWVSKYQGALTQSRLDRAVVARYFAFLVISQLVIFTLIGVGFSEC